MAGDKAAKETKKAAADAAPKGKAKRKDEGKEEAERPKKAAKAEKAAAAPKAKAEPAAKGKGKKAADEGGKAKKEKKVKDPNAPKKNLTAFMFFSNANRDKVKTDNPGVSFGEVGKLLGERWKSLDSDEKSEYEEMAKKDKDRYLKAMESYQGGQGATAAPAAKPKAKAKPAPAKKKEEVEEEDDEEEEDGDDGGSDAEEEVEEDDD
ncbi:hypothetical protein PLESTF_000819700 [Pleodorina starrii]|nr:hypothetical protein PLESTM_001674100 [Pleodorina starrii]GLC69350.1 hypothetical protein PLESTF_000819700 [Pleodorina starrii]